MSPLTLRLRETLSPLTLQKDKEKILLLPRRDKRGLTQRLLQLIRLKKNNRCLMWLVQPLLHIMPKVRMSLRVPLVPLRHRKGRTLFPLCPCQRLLFGLLLLFLLAFDQVRGVVAGDPQDLLPPRRDQALDERVTRCPTDHGQRTPPPLQEVLRNNPFAPI